MDRMDLDARRDHVELAPPPQGYARRVTSAILNPELRTAWHEAVLLLVAAAVLRLVVAFALPLVPDEAYYWEWSRRLAAGYFDHPPAIAFVVAAGTAVTHLFGGAEGTASVRFFSIVCGFVASLAVAATARRMAGDRAGRTAAIIITVMPLTAGLVLATPDAPLLATYAVAVYALVRALRAEVGSARSLQWWCVAGLATGLAFTSKLTAILLPIGVLAAVATHRGLWPRFREPGPYAATAIATLVFLPVLVWNAGHEWVSFGFQLRHGFGAVGGSGVARELEFLGGQAGLASPVLFVMMAMVVYRELRLRDPVRWTLAVVATVTIAFFVVSAARRRVEANWPAAAYVPATVLLATVIWSSTRERWVRIGMWTGAALTLTLYAHALFGILPLEGRRDPLARAAGWGTLATRASALADGVARATQRPTWIAANRYQDAASIAFNAVSHPITFSLNVDARRNQYDLWPAFREVAKPGDNMVLVVGESADTPPLVARLAPHFAEARREALVEMKHGDDVVETARLWVLSGWNGDWPGPPSP